MDEDKLREWGFISSWERKLREESVEDFCCLLGVTKITEPSSFETAQQRIQQSSSCRAFLSGKLLLGLAVRVSAVL